MQGVKRLVVQDIASGVGVWLMIDMDAFGDALSHPEAGLHIRERITQFEVVEGPDHEIPVTVVVEQPRNNCDHEKNH